MDGFVEMVIGLGVKDLNDQIRSKDKVIRSFHGFQNILLKHENADVRLAALDAIEKTFATALPF